jgi:pimeloyl-ACP methyl ester carboxylesterase
VIRFDLPGSGRSDRVEGPLSIERFVQATLRVCGGLGVERAQVAAHSLGTIIAFHLAVQQPRLVQSLALFGPLLAPPDVVRPQLRARGEKATAEGVIGMQAIADALLQTAISAETRTHRPVAAAFVRELLMRQSPAGYGRTCEALAGAAPADPARIDCPALLVTGDEDAVAPPQSVRQIGERMARARVELLSRCGHWTMIEKPEECRRLLQEFYRGIR